MLAAKNSYHCSYVLPLFFTMHITAVISQRNRQRNFKEVAAEAAGTVEIVNFSVKIKESSASSIKSNIARPKTNAARK